MHVTVRIWCFSMQTYLLHSDMLFSASSIFHYLLQRLCTTKPGLGIVVAGISGDTIAPSHTINSAVSRISSTPFMHIRMLIV